MGLVIDLVYDASVNSAPAAFKSVINSVVQFYESYFVDPITITIDVGYGEVAGLWLGGSTLGASETYLDSFTYAQLRNALIADATSGTDFSAIASLPATNPLGSGTYSVPQAEAKALGLITGSTGIDGYIGFSSTLPIDYDASNGVSVGAYNFYGVVAHEMSEVMGRLLLTGSGYAPLDLFHYSATGVRDRNGTTPGYFSVNGGVTDLANFNTNPNGDFGDWASGGSSDAFNAFASPGVVNPVSAVDLAVLDALGYTVAPTTSAGPSVAQDFNGDRRSDILWRNSDGTTVIWEMNGSQVQAAASIGQPDSTWQIAGTGDFNGDGRADILWRNTNGATVIWEMNGTQIEAALDLGQQPDGTWHVVGIGDFNGDGKSDILWRNNDGTTVIWEMNGNQIQTTASIGQVGTSWQVAGIGDFNRDGKSDILWRNNDGTTVIWEMNGTQVEAALNLGQQLDSTWQVAAIGDFNGDGKSDILWRNNSGTTLVQEMNGSQVQTAATIGQPGSTGSVADVGDFNGDGKSDILWRNTSGATVMWTMNGTQVQSAVTIAQPDNTWHVLASV